MTTNMTTNTTSSCGGAQPFSVSGGQTNSCAWSINANNAISYQVAACCGIGNSPTNYSTFEAPNCFRICKIMNYTSTDLQQNSVILSNCLASALGEKDGVYCSYAPGKKSGGESLRLSGRSWVGIAMWSILIGSMLLTL